MLTQCVVVAGEVAGLREAAERARGLHQESQQREKVLVRRLAAKEQEMQDYVVSSTSLHQLASTGCVSILYVTPQVPRVNLK